MKKHAKELTAIIILMLIIGMAAYFLPQANRTIATSANPLTTALKTEPSPETVTMEPPLESPSLDEEITAPTPIPTVQQPQVKTVTLLFAGDVMAHEKQVERHKFGSNYDFTIDYKYIKQIISKADIALCNVESPLKGEGPYTGFPHFNMPDSIMDALSYAGFDVIANANNHTRDQLDEVIGRTASVLSSKGFTVVGTATGEEGDTKYDIVEKNGIKVGFVNFTNSLNRGIGKNTDKYVNVLRRDGKYDTGYKMMKEEIDALRAAGAEFIVVYMHWGNENQLKGNKTQAAMVQEIADLGADLIIGNHPHVPQDVTEYTSTVTGKTVLVYYSLGNLVSNQPYNYGPGHGYCETGILALIKLKKGEDGIVAVDAAGYLTTYVHKPVIKVQYTENGKERTKETKAYYIVPAQLAAANQTEYESVKGTLFSHIKTGIENGQNILGKAAENLVYYSFFQEYTDWPW